MSDRVTKEERIARLKRMANVKQQQFGRLLAISEVAAVGGKRRWLCQCVCGMFKEVSQSNLVTGAIKSCGCLHRETSRQNCISRSRHGMASSPEFRVWSGMRTRCENRNCKDYPQYGGRGITISDEWKDFSVFYRDMGPRPGKGFTIERIDGNSGYRKENCVWATVTEQNNNKRDNVLLEFGGEVLTVAQWSRRLSISEAMLRKRLEYGWGIERALTAQARITKRKGKP